MHAATHHHHMQQSLHAHATTHHHHLRSPSLSSHLVCFAFVRAHYVQAASRFIGMEGLLVTDDRDGLPFGVQFIPGETRAGAFYSLEELLPVGAAEGGLALEELPVRFSTAPTGQLVSAGLLGAANLGAVLYLGGMLSRLAGVPVRLDCPLPELSSPFLASGSRPSTSGWS